MPYEAQPASELSLFTESQLYWLHRKGWMATKFTRLNIVYYWSSNVCGISQTSALRALDHSAAKMLHCSRSWMTCRRQRSTKLLTTFANVWMHAPRTVVDILNIRYELYREVFSLNSVCCSETVMNCVITRCLSSNRIHARCVVTSENSLSGSA